MTKTTIATTPFEYDSDIEVALKQMKEALQRHEDYVYIVGVSKGIGKDTLAGYTHGMSGYTDQLALLMALIVADQLGSIDTCLSFLDSFRTELMSILAEKSKE